MPLVWVLFCDIGNVNMELSATLEGRNLCKVLDCRMMVSKGLAPLLQHYSVHGTHVSSLRPHPHPPTSPLTPPRPWNHEHIVLHFIVCALRCIISDSLLQSQCLKCCLQFFNGGWAITDQSSAAANRNSTSVATSTMVTSVTA